MKPSLAEIGNILGGDSKAADRHMYGQIQSVITDASGKVTGYEVSLGGGSDTLRCRKIVGASVGDTVMVTRMANGIAVVTGTVGGDADALKALEETEDLQDMIGDGSTTGIKVETEYCLHTSNQTAPGPGAVWSEDLPAYIAGRYYWKRTKTTYADNSAVYSTPILDGLSQLSAEADYLLDSVNNHFWTDNTGAYVSENDKSYASGYATRIGSSGIAQMYNGVVLNTFTGSGITYYAYDPNASDSRVRLVTYGTTGIEFNDDIDFILGNALGNFIKWDSTQNKIIIHADTIEMGGTPVSTQDGNAWYTGTAMTYTDSTARIYSNSGITDAHVGDMYLNTSTSNVYVCTVAGAANVAKWLYQTNIQGDDGVTIEETKVYYGVSSSGTNPPTTWYTYVPSVSAGQYLWTDTYVRYSDGTHTDSYSVARQGQNGTDVTSQYMWFDSYGTYQGLNIKYTNYNNRININASGINLYDGNGESAASFGQTVRVGHYAANDFCLQLFAGSEDPQTFEAKGGLRYVYDQTACATSHVEMIDNLPNPDIPYLYHEAKDGCVVLKNSGGYFMLNLTGRAELHTHNNDGGNNGASITVHTSNGNGAVSLHVGSAGTNHGVYSRTHDQWIIHADSNAKIRIPPVADSSTKALYITSAGVLQTTSSTRKVKKDIDDIRDWSLDPTKLYNLRVVQFRYKDAETWGDDLKPGFIAEEVMDAYPPAACGDGKGGATDWEPRNIIPPMLKLIQLQKKQIDKLEERLDRLYA